jgi:hypothetical protein
MKEKGEDVNGLEWCDFSFGLSVCGSYPPPLFPPSVVSALSSSSLSYKMLQSKINTPAFHVQGLQDEWHWAGQGLIDKWYEVGEGKSEVRAWEMGHYYPVKPEESEEIGAWMVEQLKGGKAAAQQ